MASQANTRKHRNAEMYIDGNTVRRLQYEQAIPVEIPEQQRNTRQRDSQKPHQATRTKARKKALQMSVGYVAFLSVAAVASLFICVNYLKLQAEATSQRKEVAALEQEYSEMKLANDEAFSKTVSSVDLDEIRDIAINELGMVYANQGQIITYDKPDKDYVRQYEEVPED